jgi:hypothetical protein
MLKSLSEKRLCTLALLALLALVAGCGGGSKDESHATAEQAPNTGEITTHGKPLSRVEFIKQASAICEAAKERASEEFSTYIRQNTIPTSGPGMVAKAADVVNTVFGPDYELQIEKISGLGAPQGDKQRVDAILTAMQQGVERARQQPLQFIRHNTALNQASKLAAAYGLNACSSGGG